MTALENSYAWVKSSPFLLNRTDTRVKQMRQLPQAQCLRGTRKHHSATFLKIEINVKNQCKQNIKSLNKDRNINRFMLSILEHMVKIMKKLVILIMSLNFWYFVHALPQNHPLSLLFSTQKAETYVIPMFILVLANEERMLVRHVLSNTALTQHSTSQLQSDSLAVTLSLVAIWSSH